MQPRTVALLVALSLTGGWLLASILTPPVAELQTLPNRAPARTARVPESPTPFSQQLHRKLQQAPAAPQPRRNPFAFGQARRSNDLPAVSAGAAIGTREETAAPAPPPVPVGPIYTLAGIGSSNADSGAVLTAVLADGRDVHLVKVGDVIGGYRVTQIDERSVTLADAADQRWTLRLRN